MTPRSSQPRVFGVEAGFNGPMARPGRSAAATREIVAAACGTLSELPSGGRLLR
jgi:hypothetical protein